MNPVWPFFTIVLGSMFGKGIVEDDPQLLFGTAMMFVCTIAIRAHTIQQMKAELIKKKMLRSKTEIEQAMRDKVEVTDEEGS